MSTLRLERPSFGFSLVVLTYALTLAFFLWGFQTPPLDRVWQLHHELKIGAVDELRPSDRELLLSEMARHPALAAALLPSGQLGLISANRDGWIDTTHVTIVRTARSAAGARILLDIQTPPQNMPYYIDVSGSGWQRHIEIAERGLASIGLPPPPAAPELITLALKGPRLRPDPSSLGVRVRFEPAEESGDRGEEDDDDAEDGE